MSGSSAVVIAAIVLFITGGITAQNIVPLKNCELLETATCLTYFDVSSTALSFSFSLLFAQVCGLCGTRQTLRPAS
jgi:hypothetical protein